MIYLGTWSLWNYSITQELKEFLLSIGIGRQKRNNAQIMKEEVDSLISFLISQGKPEFNVTLQRLREVSVRAAQAIHTFNHLKGVVLRDDSLLILRKKTSLMRGNTMYFYPSAKYLNLAVYTIHRQARDFKLAYIQHIFQTTYI